MPTDVTSRPFAGNWEPNLRRVVRHTPDALVYINGDTGIPGCSECGGRVDIQPFITSVNCEPSTNPIATATISLSIPKYRSAGLFADGRFALRPGLEVHIYYRGYFPARNLLAAEAESTPDNDGSMYPYYLVFHGVVTNSSYSYSGGEYTATLSCADLLHFWQYQRMVAQGSILANRPVGSKVKSSWMGHNFSGMSPYSVIYTLYRDVFGAAGGVETNWLGADATNASAVSSQTGESLFSLSILYWQKRFSQTVSNLRMFGADGKVYNAFQSAFLAKLTSEQASSLAKTYAAAEAQTGSAKDPGTGYALYARTVGYNPFSTYSTGGGSSGAADSLGTNTAALQSYVSDISKWGQINLLETEYLTKLEVANEITRETGFEFYQDVDGDIVFKPPFYNMDTSDLRVYRIEPEDVISFDVSDKEPDVTVIKWTGSHFSNLKVPSLEGEFGKRAEFIDYRLVAQFGWRQETFDTAYYSDERSAYYAAIGKMDIYNIGVKTGSVSIPLRPELRPGYPVYVVHLDCFFYCTGISHSFSFGGQCTSSLTLVGKRAKFHAPGRPPEDGRPATVADIRLDNMHLPPLPLTLPAGAVSSRSSTYSTGLPSAPTGETGFVNAYRKTQGFPNVVMALDPQLVNPLQFARGFDLETLETDAGIRNLIKAIVMGPTGVVQRPPLDESTADEKSKSFDGPWVIQMSNGEWSPLPSVSELTAAARRTREAGNALQQAEISFNTLTEDSDAEAVKAAQDGYSSAVSNLTSAGTAADQAFGILVAAARDTYERSFPGSNETATALELVSDYKSSYSVGKTLPGYYRYYSSAHPDPSNQGMLKLSVDANGTVTDSGERHAMSGRATQFAPDGTALVEGDVAAGIPIATGENGSSYVVKATHEIRSFDIARLEVAVVKGRVVQRGNLVQAFPEGDLAEALRSYFFEQIEDADDVSEAKLIADYEPLFASERSRLAFIVESPSSFPPPPDVANAVAPTVPTRSGNGGTNGLFSYNVLAGVDAVGAITSAWNPSRTLFKDGEWKTAPHRGTDLGVPVGTPVLAAAPGTVRTTVTGQPPHRKGDTGYGNVVYITHADGYETRYAHLSAVNVRKGDPVTSGQVVGLSGNSGSSTGPHLHFELLSNGRQVDAQLYQATGVSFAPVSAGSVAATAPEPTPEPAPAPPVATTEGSPDAALVSNTSFNASWSGYINSTPMPAGVATIGEMPGNSLNAKIVALATEMADALANRAAEAMRQVAYSEEVSTLDTGKYAAAWVAMFPEGSTISPIVRNAAGAVITNDASQVYHVPVYPVSDERGYEVVGTYPYGRGFNLSDATFGQLIGPTGELPDYDAVEAFIDALVSSGGTTAQVANVIGASNLDSVTKAELAAGMDPAVLGQTDVATVLSDVVPGVTGAGSNTPASTAQGIGVFSPVNVAYGLADMAVGGTSSSSCSCLTHQADIALLRDPVDPQGYIVVEGTEEAFAEYIREVAAVKVPGWAAAQDNYRGYVTAVGGPEGVTAAYNQAVDAARSQVNAAGASLGRAVDTLTENT